MRRLTLVLVCLMAGMLAPALASCAAEVATTPFPVAQPLPDQEEARYDLVDSKGNPLGTAVLSLATEGDTRRFTLAYDFGPTQTDKATVVTRKDTLRPMSSERLVRDGEKTDTTHTTYADTQVTTEFTDGKKPKTRTAKLTGDAYDNIAAVFLWRTIAFNINQNTRYINVVVDPRNGQITRAAGTLAVSGREDVQLPSGPVATWRVRFTSAGVTNTAWYRADGDHALVKYEITRGPTLILQPR